MFRSAQSTTRRAGSFTLSVLFHLLLLLIFPHLSSVFDGRAVGEGSLGGGEPVRIVTLQPWAAGATSVIPNPGHGQTPDQPPTSETPTPGRPQRAQLQPAPHPTPAAPATPVRPAQAIAPETQRTPTPARPSGSQTPPSSGELLTSPTGKVLVQAEPNPTATALLPNRSEPDRATQPATATPTAPAVSASSDTKPGADGHPGGLSATPAPPPAPPVGRGPWLAGPAPQYPKNAQNAGIEGVVLGQVLVKSSGELSVRLVSSSGSAVLDRQALGTIADRWQGTYRPPAGWVTVVGWRAEFSQQDGYQVRVTQDEAFNVTEAEIPPTGPVPRPQPPAASAGTR